MPDWIWQVYVVGAAIFGVLAMLTVAEASTWKPSGIIWWRVPFVVGGIALFWPLVLVGVVMGTLEDD